MARIKRGMSGEVKVGPVELDEHAGRLPSAAGRAAHAMATEIEAEVVHLRAAPPRYHLAEQVGFGRITEVFRAELVGAEGFARTVAVKRLRSQFHHDGPSIERLCREARALARLHHPNVVSAHDFQYSDDGQLFMVLEFVDGVDLRRLTASGPLPPAVAIFIASEILRGLRYAHRVLVESSDPDVVIGDGFSHCILLSWVGAVKISDFAASHDSASLETPARAMALDERSDLRFVGNALWGMLTGKRLRLDAVTRPDLTRSMPADLGAVAMKLLEPDPARGFPDAGAALAALFACEGASPLCAFGLEQFLAERFPHEAPRRARPSMVPPPDPPMARLWRGPRRRTATVKPPPRSLATSLARRWAFLAAVTACAALGTFAGLLGGLAVAGAWRAGNARELAIVVMRRSTNEGRRGIAVRLTCTTLDRPRGSPPAAGTGLPVAEAVAKVRAALRQAAAAQ